MTDETPPSRPRFWHTERWQKFAREVGSVVLGVLIALGLGAIASEIGWKIEVANARDAIAAELGETIGQAEERVKIAPCVERRLDELAAIIDAAAEAGRLPPLGRIGSPPHRTWTSGVWDSIVSAQTATHFDRDSLDNLSGTYEFVTQLNAANMRELAIWTKLYGIVGPGRRLSDVEAVSLRDAVSQARFTNRLMGMAGLRMHQIADAYDIFYEPKTVREYSGGPAGEYGICKPIAKEVPAAYGEAPLKGVIESVLKDPIKREP